MPPSKPFVANVDIMIPFNSKVMLVNDIAGSENGQTWIRARTDGPPVHTHPLQEEWIQAISGGLEVYLNKKWNKLLPEESILIPENAPHTYRNSSPDDCVFAYKITPKGNFSEMMQCFEQLSKDSKLTSLKKFSSLLYLAMAFKKFKKDVRSISPPDFVMTIMAAIAKLRGYKI